MCYTNTENLKLQLAAQKVYQVTAPWCMEQWKHSIVFSCKADNEPNPTYRLVFHLSS